MPRRQLMWRRLRRQLSNETSNGSGGAPTPPKKKQRTRARRPKSMASDVKHPRGRLHNRVGADGPPSIDDVVVVPKIRRQRSKSEPRPSRSPNAIIPKKRSSSALSDDEDSTVRRLYSSNEELLPRPYVPSASGSSIGIDIDNGQYIPKEEVVEEGSGNEKDSDSDSDDAKDADPDEDSDSGDIDDAIEEDEEDDGVDEYDEYDQSGEVEMNFRRSKRESKRRSLTVPGNPKRITRTERIGLLEQAMRVKNEEMKKLLTQQKVVLKVIEEQRKERLELSKEVFWLKKDINRVRAAWNNP